LAVTYSTISSCPAKRSGAGGGEVPKELRHRFVRLAVRGDRREVESVDAWRAAAAARRHVAGAAQHDRRCACAAHWFTAATGCACRPSDSIR
jgi:hypothetical protein